VALGACGEGERFVASGPIGPAEFAAAIDRLMCQQAARCGSIAGAQEAACEQGREAAAKRYVPAFSIAESVAVGRTRWDAVRAGSCVDAIRLGGCNALRAIESDACQGLALGR